MRMLDVMSVTFRVITSRQMLLEVMLKMHTDEALFIFLFTDVEDMEVLNKMRLQVLDRKIITILPDDSVYSRSIGCSVLPRFQALLSDDFSMVAEIAARIISIEGDGGHKALGKNE
jgi:hypothetical protein